MFTFKRDIPESTGLSSLSVLNVLKELDEKNIPMHSFLLMKNDTLVFEKYYAPYDANTLHRMFSITKSFTAAAIALLIEEGKIDPDAPITDYFPEYVDESTHAWIRATTIRNMLMMRTCHASTTYKVDMRSDWVESFFKVPPTHKPGTVFHYDTSSAHVLCALAEKLSGMDILDYLKKEMLRHVDFSDDSYMVKDPFGVSIGGSGLMATPMDVLKFLYILSHNGSVQCTDQVTRQLLSPEFISLATSNLSDTLMTAPVPSEAQGYGMQIWQNEKGGFTLYGMGGQLAISIPDKDMLIVTTADTQGIQGGNQVIYNAVYEHLCDADSGCSLGQNGYGTLCSYSDTLAIAPPRLPSSYRKTSKARLNGVLTYSLTDNKQGYEAMTLNLSDASPCSISFRQKENLHTITFGIERMCEGLFPIYNIPYTAGGIWLRENVLYVRAHLVGECVGSVHFQFYFGEKDITVFMRKIEETYFGEFDGHLYGTLT